MHIIVLHKGGNVMAARRRGTFEVMVDILNETKNPINQSKLLRRANINHSPFIKHVNYLENLGFIMKVPPPKITNRAGRSERSVKVLYQITLKGHNLLRQISQEPLSEFLLYRTFDITGEM